MNANQRWLVCEANPWPDNYIPIFYTSKNDENKKHGYSVFTNLQYAWYRARLLRQKYGVKQIRLFYPNSVSIIVKHQPNIFKEIKKLRPRNT